MLAPRAHEKGVDLILRISPDLHREVGGDLLRIRQVLVNLVGNAIKFTAAGQVQVQLSVVQQSDSEQLVRISVLDSGIGITEENLALLFGQFVQADPSTTREFGGTGLGLAIAKQLVELMGGEISVESTFGAGSVFSVTLPLQTRPVGERTVRDPHLALAGRRILVIDDNAINREVLREQLAAWNASCDEAEGGARALELLAACDKHKQYDAIILDFNMPAMDGGAFARAVREQPSLRHLPILLLSSVGGVSQATELNAPVDAILTKPVRQRELAERLTQLVQGTPHAAFHTATAPHAVANTMPEKKVLTQITATFPGIRVLLAEDNSVNRLVALGALEAFGCLVVEAHNGADAVRAAASQPFDIVLMDCMMPEMDGFAATRAIRASARPGAPRVPIVALTASAMDGERDRTIAAGMDDYLSKPFRIADLATVIERWTQPTVSSAVNVVAGDAHDAVPSAFLLDQKALDNFREFPGGIGILIETIGIFRRNAPAQLAQLQAAIAEDDRDTVHRAAHTLKSSSAMLGMSTLADVLRTIERESRDLSRPSLDTLFSEAQCAFDGGDRQLALLEMSER